MKYKAFISYRRSDCAERAQLVKLAIMEQGYSEDDIFLDLHSIHEGEFPQHIKDALFNTEFFILLLSNDSFIRNLEKDYYIDEINMALELKLRIIPIVFDNLDVNNLAIPQKLVDKNLKLKNTIPYYPEYPKAFREKLTEFMKPATHNLWDLIKMPTLVLSIYTVVSLISGVGMWIYDNCLMPEEKQIETVADKLQIGDGVLVYSFPEETFVFKTSTQEIKYFYGDDNSLITSSISKDQIIQTGFWTVSVGLVYELSRTRLKPHGNWKSVLAYVAVGISVVAGVGLGCTLERMAFPKQYSNLIHENLYNKGFWQKVVNKKFSQRNTSLIE